MLNRISWAGLFVAGFAAAGDGPGEDVTLVPAPHSIAAPDRNDTEAAIHSRALQSARSGDYRAALADLRHLRQAAPSQQTYLFDLVAVSAWAGLYAEALQHGEGLTPAALPDYVVRALALAFRHTQQTDPALNLYALLRARHPEQPDPAIGSIQTLIDAGRAEEALVQAKSLFQRFPNNAEVLAALIRAYDHNPRWMEALELAQTLQQGRPGNAQARSLQMRALWRLGAPHAANRLRPADLPPAEQQALQHDSLAFAQRWARIDIEAGNGPERWKELDRVIEEMDRLAGEMESRQPGSSRGLAQDRVSALTDRLRMSDSLSSYDALASAATPPAYVRLARAHALLYQEQPEAAQAAFAELMAENPDLLPTESRLAYFYALLESERYDEALAFIDAQGLQPWMNTGIPGSRRPDPDFPRLQLTQALARSYTDRLAEGQERLESMARLAPANNDVGNGLAATYQMRGWNFAAEAHHDWMLGATPEYAWSRLGRFHSRLALADYPAAERDLQDAAAALEEEKAVTRASRAWETHNLRELRIEAESGRSAGSAASPLGNRDRSLDAWLYSTPFAYHWRAYAHTHYATAAFGEDKPVRTANGAGLEYRRRYWSGSAEIYALRGDGSGLQAQAAYTPDDHWRLDGGFAVKTLAAPLRAYAAGVDARSINLGLGYRWHESRSLRLGTERLHFDDGNQRQSWSAAWSERLVTGPIYKVDLRSEVYASSNSLPSASAAYFNPRRDRSLSLTLGQEWTQFRRYERSLRHRLELGLGDYWQEGYGSGDIRQARYELIYAPDDRLELHLGISRTRRPYDGTLTTLDALTLMADWRF